MMRRRDFLIGLGAAIEGGRGFERAKAADAGIEPALSSLLPDGTRAEAVMAALEGKQPLIKLAFRPPNYESPVDVFRTVLRANDRFFVRYHLADIPNESELRDWTLRVGGDAAQR